VHFVYRSHYEGPLGKLIRHLPDVTVLDWFRRGWECDDPKSWVQGELGADVYGLSSIFAAAQKHGLPRPTATGELREVLAEHLYVEGDEDSIRLDEHSLRVRTDDDEVELAYFFLAGDLADTAPDRLAYLFQSWPLPGDTGGTAPAPFVCDVPVTAVTPAGAGDATTYAVFLTFYDGESLACSEPVEFPGVGLPELADHLRTADPDGGDEWPPELLVLRALTAPGEDTLGPALDRCNHWPGFDLGAEPWPELPDEHDAAHRRAVKKLAKARYVDGRRPDASLLQVDDHLAQLAMHSGQSFGYQQWFLFDTVWAAAHPHLARSLLRYAGHWDPLQD
jgi:hypothetical protein